MRVTPLLERVAALYPETVESPRERPWLLPEPLLELLALRARQRQVVPTPSRHLRWQPRWVHPVEWPQKKVHPRELKVRGKARQKVVLQLHRQYPLAE